MICTKFDWNWPDGSGGEDFFFRYKHKWMWFSLLWPLSTSRGPWFKETWIYITSKSFHLNMTYSGSVVLEKIFKWSHPIFVIISPLKRTRPFIWTIKNPLYPRLICIKFDWNWPAGSGEAFFNISTCEYGFSYCGPSRPRGPWCEQFWIYIISENFHVNMTSSGSVVLETKLFKWPHPFFAFF
jgi:hypothetical protein